MDLKTALALVRRYATEIAEGRIEAKKIAAMTDEELAEFDSVVFSQLKAKQEEAERLAAEN